MAPLPTVCKVEGENRIRTTPLAPNDRVTSFAQVEPTMTLEEAMAEAKRCTAASPCLYCEVCELLCPDLAITRAEETGQILIDLDYCKGCGLCAHYCPHNAIEMVMDEDE